MRRWLAPLVVAAALLGACAGDDSGSESTAGAPGSDDDTPFEGVPLAEGTPKPDFTLTDTDGDEFDFVADTEGTTTLLFFGYTHCPDICPPHLAQIAQVLDRPDAPTNVEVVFVTVDPERDTPEVIREFLDQFDPAFVGLTGDPDDIAAAQQAAGVAVAIVEEPDENGDYTVGHSGEMRAYAPNGTGYVTFPFGTRQSEFLHDLQILDTLQTPEDSP
ncbi:MAG: SCO family protein [Acidimicrobiales bacterium]